MKRKHKHVLRKIGKAGWELLSDLVDTLAFTYHPGAYFFGPAQFGAARNLEKRGWLEIEKKKGEWVAHLTEVGRLALNDGFDPEALWNAPWEGKWHLLLFDLPRTCNKQRQRLHAWLRDNYFGCLQGSLWISAHTPDKNAIDHRELDVSSECLMVVEGIVKGGYTPSQIIARAWDYNVINADYREFLNLLSGVPKSDRRLYIEKVLKAWSAAARRDPFLPSRIAPFGYLGKKAWHKRNEFLAGK